MIKLENTAICQFGTDYSNQTVCPSSTAIISAALTETDSKKLTCRRLFRLDT